MGETLDMKEHRVAPLKKKLIWFTVCFSALHTYLSFSAYAIVKTVGTTFFGDSNNPVAIDDFVSLLAAFNGGVLEVFLFFLRTAVFVLVNAIVFIVFILIFNKMYYLTAADDGKAFVKSSRYIMLSLMALGLILPIVLNRKAFPVSLITVFFDYFIFSFLAYIITRRKTKRIYLQYSKLNTQGVADASQ
jgi:hypothetical protein